MNSEELSVNIAVLEHLGWFVGEVESDEFDLILECCRPDGSILEQVPVTPFFLSLYDEEEGGLEERLWFFAPRYSTDFCNALELAQRQYPTVFLRLLGPYDDPIRYYAELCFYPFGPAFEHTGKGETFALALCYGLMECWRRRTG